MPNLAASYLLAENKGGLSVSHCATFGAYIIYVDALTHQSWLMQARQTGLGIQGVGIQGACTTNWDTSQSAPIAHRASSPLRIIPENWLGRFSAEIAYGYRCPYSKSDMSESWPACSIGAP